MDIVKPKLSRTQASFQSSKEEGNAKLREGALDDAVKEYTKALAWCERMAEGAGAKSRGTIYSNRSCAHLRRADYRRAIQDARGAIEARPNWPKGWFRLAEVFRHIGKYRQATELYAHAATLSMVERSRPDTVLEARLRAASDLAALQASEEHLQWRKPALGGSAGAALGMSLLVLNWLTESGSGGAWSALAAVLLLAMLGGGVGSVARWRDGVERARRLKPQAVLRAEDEEELRRAQQDSLGLGGPQMGLGLGSSVGGAAGVGAPSAGAGDRARAGRRRVRTRNKSMRNRTGEAPRRPLPKVAFTKT